MMKELIYKIQMLAMLSILLAGLVFISSCEEDEDDKATDKVTISSFGPSGIEVGEEFTIIGTNLDQVSSVVLAPDVEVTDFKAHNKTEIVFLLPDNVADGYVTLKSSQGDVTSKTQFGVGRPIGLKSFSPSPVKPGTEVTISGNYLELVSSIVFPGADPVTEFEEQSRTSLVVTVPMNAKTGVVTAIHDLEGASGEVQEIESEVELEVMLPEVSSITPDMIKAGETMTLSGSNLDLVTRVLFSGIAEVKSEEFDESSSATSIVFVAPENIEEGPLTLEVASLEQVTTSAISIVKPAISSIPTAPVKNGESMTIDGTDLDLVTSVTFGGGSNGTVTNQTESQIEVSIPMDAVDGAITLNTNIGVSIESATELSYVVPTISDFTPTSVNTVDNPSITVNGDNLDLVVSISFAAAEGDDPWTAEVSPAPTSFTVDVVPGSVTGKFSLTTTNGTVVTSASDLTIVPDVPNVTGVPTSGVNVGSMITLSGTNMDVSADIYFPGEEGGYVAATRYGSKSSSEIEVYVPTGVASGENVKVLFVTLNNEYYTTPGFEIFPSLPSLVKVIYDDELNDASFGLGGGWGGSSTDDANAEQRRDGSLSVKATFAGGWSGAAQFGSWGKTPMSTDGTQYFAFSIYGDAGTDGNSIQINIKPEGGDAVSQQVTIAEGEWIDHQIPLSDFGSPAAIEEIQFQDTDWSGSVYIDHVGLR